MPIRLYDSLTRDYKVLGQREPGAPPVSKEHPFTFYTCGPTVYAPAHIGNFRTFLVNDVLRRLLELEFGKDQVRHVRNLTDVDDRTIGQAKREHRPLSEITRHWTELFHRDCDALNLLRPHVEPTATSHIAEQVDMIDVLMRKGNAYRAPDGSVYFKIGSFPEYGALSRIRERELKATITAADDDHKDDVGDFALWKAYKPEEDGDVQWTGPTGAAAGRPGWHIECSAMSKKHLGTTIDLHSGGVDLLFPHHENEIAQSQCCNDTTFSRHWYHSEFLLVDGKKMSKSLGNLYTLADLTAKGFSPMAIRLALLSGHPRKQLNFTLESLHAAEMELKSILKTALLYCKAADKSIEDLYSPECLKSTNRPVFEEVWFKEVWDNLLDDLNLPGAFGRFFLALAIADTNKGQQSSNRLAEFNAFARVLFVFGIDLRPLLISVAIPADISVLAERRWTAKKAKDYASADVLRNELAAAGWSMLDGKEGYKLEPVKKA
jgi:cysteinyl-tRNA synthetase